MVHRKGNESIYTEGLADEICRRLEAGEALIAICRDKDMPPAPTVRRWFTEDYQGFAAKYARARDIGLDHMAEELIEIADDSSRDWITTEDGREIPDHDHINRSKLRVDTRKWLLSKLAAKRYGDKTTVDLNATLRDASDEEVHAKLQLLIVKALLPPPADDDAD